MHSPNAQDTIPKKGGGGEGDHHHQVNPKSHDGLLFSSAGRRKAVPHFATDRNNHAGVRATDHDDKSCLLRILFRLLRLLEWPPHVEMPPIDVPFRKCVDFPVLGSFLLHFFSLNTFFHFILPQSDDNCIISRVAIYIGTPFLAVYTIIHFMATRYIEKIKIFYCHGNPKNALQLISTLRHVRIACFLSVTVVLGSLSLLTIATGHPRLAMPTNGACIHTVLWSLLIIFFLAPQIDLWWHIGLVWALKRRANIDLDSQPSYSEGWAMCFGFSFGCGLLIGINLALG